MRETGWEVNEFWKGKVMGLLEVGTEQLQQSGQAGVVLPWM